MAVYKTHVRLDSSVKISFNSLLHEEIVYKEILSELESGRVEDKIKY